MEIDKKPFYRYCVVPMCINTTRTAPDKVFFHIPRDANIRKKWCKAMKREDVSSTSCLYCCEDHFTIEEDTENFMQYNIMALQGQKVSLRLKKGVVPHKFRSQKNVKTLPERKGALKRRRQALVEDALSEYALAQSVTGEPSAYDFSEAGPNTAPSHMDIEDYEFVDCEPDLCVSSINTPYSNEILQVDKAIQVNRKVHYRSKGVNVNITVKKNSVAISPFQIHCKDASTSP